MAFPDGLQASLLAAIEEALQTPAAQAALADEGVSVADVTEVEVSHSTLGSTTIDLPAPRA